MFFVFVFFYNIDIFKLCSFYSILGYFLYSILGSNNMVTLKATDCAGRVDAKCFGNILIAIYIFSNFKNFYSFTIMILKYSRTDTQAYSFIWLFIRTLTIAKAAITKYHYWYVVW